MELEDVQALVWVVEHGSLHATAKARGMSRSTLRRRIDRLEVAIGAPVLAVHGRGHTLTPAGALVLEHAAELLARRDAIVSRVRGALDAPEGTVNVVVCAGFPPALSAHVMAMASSTYSGVAFDVRTAARPLERVDPGTDLVVTWADHEPPTDGYSRVFHRVAVGVVASEAYIAHRGLPTSLEELREHVVLHEKGTPMAWPLRAGSSHPVQATHRLGDAYLLGCAAAAGIGLALVPQEGAGLHSSFEQLQPVLPEVIGGQRGLRFYAPIATRHRGPASAIVEHLEGVADMLESQIRAAR